MLSYKHFESLYQKLMGRMDSYCMKCWIKRLRGDNDENKLKDEIELEVNSSKLETINDSEETH